MLSAQEAESTSSAEPPAVTRAEGGSAEGGNASGEGVEGPGVSARPAGPVSTRVADLVTRRDFVETHRDSFSFGLARVEFLQRTFLGKPLWQYLAILLYIGLAIVVSRFLDTRIKARLKARAERTETHWDDILVGLADGPVKVIAFVVLIHVGLQIFDWPTGLAVVVSKATLVMVAVSVVYVVLRTVDALMDLWKLRLKDDGEKAFNLQFLALVGRVVKVIVCGVAFLTLLQNLGVNITAVLGSVSIIGLALGLAAQDTVGNLFGAVAVFMDRPFRVGDRIRVGTDVDGWVEEMGLRSTRVRTLEGFLVTVPNKTVGNSTVVNITRRPTIRGNFSVGITYDTPTDKVKRATEILDQVYRGHPMTKDAIIHFNRFANDHLLLDILMWANTTDWRQYCMAVQEINLRIKEQFKAEGIEFAFPTQTVHLRTDPGPRFEPSPSPVDPASSAPRSS